MTYLTPPPAKKAAVQLREFLQQNGVELPLALAQEALARTRGAASFQVLMAADKACAPEDKVLCVEFCRPARVSDEGRIDAAVRKHHHRDPKELRLGERLVKVALHRREPVVVRNVWLWSEEALKNEDRKTFFLHGKAEVPDERAFRELAHERAERAGRPAPRALAQCLFEVLCACNERGTPAQLGFELL